MTSTVASQRPCSPTSPTRTLASEGNETMEQFEYLDPLFPEIASTHLMDDISLNSYLDHDILSPSSSSSAHDSSSSSSSSTTTTPSPASQYDILHSDKHMIPADLLTDNNHQLLQPTTVSLPDSYHHLTTEYYARSNNIFNPSGSSSVGDISSINERLQIRVLGVPSLGAKSRVETQIKLCIQLLSSSGTKISNWSYLRLPEHMLARSKLRKTQQQKLLDGSVATMVSDESKVLTLEAKVICSTNASKSVRMCLGCVRRERKRAERTKDGKPRYEVGTRNGPSEQAPELPVEDMMEKDRDRILLFNCSPMVNFSSGDTILPTRITCYCRHHNEKVGFRIQFVMRNDQGYVVAKGCSPPIMITDDHKSSKQRNSSISGASVSGSNGNNSDDKDQDNNTSRKRGRRDYESQQTLDTPAPSRRGSLSDNSTTASSSLHLNPSASFIIPSSEGASYQFDHPTPSTDGMTTPNSSISSSPQTMFIGNDLTMTPLLKDEPAALQQQPQHAASSDVITDLLHSTASAGMMDTSHLQRSPYGNNSNSNSNSISSNNFYHQHHHQQEQQNRQYQQHSFTPINNNNDEISWPNSRRRRIANSNNSTFTTEETSLWRTEYNPQLERLVPSQGPTYGGVEVTVLGSGFYRGLTCLFGEHAASTVYWNPNTLVCVLPPAATPGPVVVSFKEHPIVLEGQDVALFTYYDASDQALLELALQVVGLKMTGKLHDAKHIAMLIVRGDQQKSQQQPHQQHQQRQQRTNTYEELNCDNDSHDNDNDDDCRHTVTREGSSRDGSSVIDGSDTGDTGDDDDDDDGTDEDNGSDSDSLDVQSWHDSDADLERHVINALEASDAHDVMHTNPNGHTMLHLAVLLRYGALTKMLLCKMNHRVINQADRNGCTALHFACLQNNAPMVQLLLEAGARPTEKCSVGSALELARDNTVRSILLQSLSLERPTSSSSPSSSSTSSTSANALAPLLPRRLSFKSHVRRFYRLKQRGEDSNVAGSGTVDTLDGNGLGFVQYKHDRRLYLFWLPLLIVTIGLLYYQILGDRTLLTLLQDMIPFRRHGLNSIVGY